MHFPGKKKRRNSLIDVYKRQGLYYFSKEGNDPSADTLGSMLKDCWAQEADENGAWHYLGSDGKAVNTGEKAGWQQPEKDWYYLCLLYTSKNHL